ncbi:hypothetical protein [Methylorubrum extorquens]|jgi:hypothetical protein|uniref:hypothetical protein n=1 Tax=Methylorubrum extorquens TaxID=408 RepID=UPI0022377D03|nr:hypothetical protein [Methylorubrum extorquens]UYW25216.1 hypothetical protein OKC48_18350 [Methylorubrum extorquens]UYW34926.1 hypothetical protein OKB92_12800 [Methylorubrum extorquens]
MKEASPELEAFVDELIRLGSERDYRPTIFIGMRDRHGTLGAMKRLVRSGDIQSGFQRLSELGLQEHTVEAGILKFRSEFDKADIECAEWRLKQARGEASA